MSKPNLSADQIVRLVDLADILMPATDKLPAPRQLNSYTALLELAFVASGLTRDEVQQALDVLPTHLDWNTVKGVGAGHPVAFETLALLTSGAYVMAPEVLEILGYPVDRRNPAGPMDAADEYEAGILEPVINRGTFYRDPRAVGAGGNRPG
ncbi:MAG: hypothetical protein KDK89_09300 [Alphaproteobacteria bacterium]|nr:hypothetical protein [Alphaproteobacteria bacterium]